MFNFNVLKSKTFWGALIAAAGHVVVTTPGLINPQAGNIITAVGGLIAALGIRDAVAKGPSK